MFGINIQVQLMSLHTELWHISCICSCSFHSAWCTQAVHVYVRNRTLKYMYVLWYIQCMFVTRCWIHVDKHLAFIYGTNGAIKTVSRGLPRQRLLTFIQRVEHVICKCRLTSSIRDWMADVNFFNAYNFWTSDAPSTCKVAFETVSYFSTNGWWICVLCDTLITTILRANVCRIDVSDWLYCRKLFALLYCRKLFAAVWLRRNTTVCTLH